MRGLARLAVALGLFGSLATAQTTDPWSGVGSASFYWHNRYHGLLAMSAYGNYSETCPQTFTEATLQVQYPGNTNTPFEVVGTWGPTPLYQSEGFMVKVHEMNKILMVFKGFYGWQTFNATLSPFLGIGCDSTCKAYTGALEAWAEVKAATNDMEAIKANQGDLVCPAVFNNETAALYDSLFEGDATQRTVANDDSIPAAISVGLESDYTFVRTGIHVFGTSGMYGQDFEVCEGWNEDPRCMGGASEADHYFYFTNIGTCGSGWAASYNTTFNAEALASDQSAYAATATTPLSTPLTSPAPFSTTSASTSTFTPDPTILDDLAPPPTSSAAPWTSSESSSAGRTLDAQTAGGAAASKSWVAMGSSLLMAGSLWIDLLLF